MGTHHKKSLSYSTKYPLSLANFNVHVSSSNQTEVGPLFKCKSTFWTKNTLESVFHSLARLVSPSHTLTLLLSLSLYIKKKLTLFNCLQNWQHCRKNKKHPKWNCHQLFNSKMRDPKQSKSRQQQIPTQNLLNDQ